MNYYLAEKWVIMICNHLEAPVLELGPATAHVGGVLPDHLGVVAHPPAALLPRPDRIEYYYPGNRTEQYVNDVASVKTKLRKL